MPIKPKALQKGDSIGVISPAGPITKESISDFEFGLVKLKKLGFRVVLGRHTYFNYGYLAGKDTQRAYDLIDMFRNKDIKAIICSRGGYGTERLVDFLDLEVIKNNPKIFVGYSNISILLNLFFSHANLITFHGPMIKEFGPECLDFNINCLFDTISQVREKYDIVPVSFNKSTSTSQQKASGKLVGGNLSTIIGLLGTRYEIDTKGNILFLEDIDEPAYSVDRMLTHLKNSGKLNECSGFIVGDFTNCDDSNEKGVYEVIRETLNRLGKPVLYNVRSGHGRYNTTLPIGANVEINCLPGIISVLEPVVC